MAAEWRWLKAEHDRYRASDAVDGPVRLPCQFGAPPETRTRWAMQRVARVFAAVSATPQRDWFMLTPRRRK